MKKFALLFIITLVSIVTASAQHFSGGFYAGINAAQIDGDAYYGYYHGGLDVAATAQLPVSPKLFFSLDLGYSQKGAQDKFSETTGNLYKININYADVPLLFHYYDRKKLGAYGGLQFSRLLGTFHETINNNFYQGANYQGITSVYNNDYELVLGGTYYITPRLSFDVRFCYSIVSFGYSPQGIDRNGDVFNNLLQFRFGYIFGQDFDTDRSEKWLKIPM